MQESATNAVRHGCADHVEAEAFEGEGLLHVTIRDDGGGIPDEHRTGFGLSGMRERVGALGGTFALDKASPGTVVRITLPVPTERPDDSHTAPTA